MLCSQVIIFLKLINACPSQQKQHYLVPGSSLLFFVHLPMKVNGSGPLIHVRNAVLCAWKMYSQQQTEYSVAVQDLLIFQKPLCSFWVSRWKWILSSQVEESAEMDNSALSQMCVRGGHHFSRATPACIRCQATRPFEQEPHNLSYRRSGSSTSICRRRFLGARCQPQNELFAASWVCTFGFSGPHLSDPP